MVCFKIPNTAKNFLLEPAYFTDTTYTLPSLGIQPALSRIVSCLLLSVASHDGIRGTNALECVTARPGGVQGKTHP